jgi:hypothetical protein
MLAASIAAQPPKYDGRWWKSLTFDEQDAFASGYLDCYVWDARRADYSKQPISQQIREVSSFYTANPELLYTPVTEVLRRLPRYGGVSRGTERHGTYDGDFWRQLNPSGRVAFVRGYTVCRSLYLATRFSATPEGYAQMISIWYGLSSRDESELNEKTANEKIGDVLVRLRDRIPK